LSRAYFSFLLALIVILVSGCEYYTAQGTVKKEGNKTIVPIQVSIYKHYEDGVELKFQLLNGKNANGTWKIQKCGQEEIQANKGAAIIYGVE
jgi:hypothetical protein